MPSNWLRCLCAAALGLAAHAALASTGEQFASQVRVHRDAMARSDSAVGEAASFCAALAPARAMDEPRCVAWRLHVRALSDQQRWQACEARELPVVSHIRRCVFDGLAGSAG